MRDVVTILTLLHMAAALPAFAQSGLPTETLRATYIATNPVQAFLDKATGETRGPGADLARELAKRLGVAVAIKGVTGPQGVIDSLKSGEADIGFVAYDPIRAAEVDFAQNYALAQNSYIVPEASPIKSVADIDRPGTRIAVGERDAGDFFLTRNLKAAEIRRNPGGNMEVGLKWLADGDVHAYAANRQRLSEVVRRNPGVRLLPDNFYGVEQSIAVKQGNRQLLEALDKLIADARASGLTAAAIERAGLVGVDVAPQSAR